jgi:hypothetical protein
MNECTNCARLEARIKELETELGGALDAAQRAEDAAAERARIASRKLSEARREVQDA